MILHCTCYNKAQDILYGDGNRVFNYPCKSKSTGKYTAAKCTVCKSIQEVGVLNEESRKRGGKKK